MEKRFILAIALSLLILLTWSALVSKSYHIENKVVTKQEVQPVINVSPKHAPSVDIDKPISQAALFQYSTHQFKINFVEQLGAIQDITFKTHQDYKFALKSGLLLDDNSLSFKKERISTNTVSFVHTDESKKIIKEFIFSNSNYSLWLELIVQNVSNAPIKLNFSLILADLDLSGNNKQVNFQDVFVSTKDKSLHLNPRKNVEFQDVKFLSLRDRYFCAILEPESDNYTGFIKKINHQVSEVGLSLQELQLAPGQEVKKRFHIFLGPQDLRLINSIQPTWSAVIYYGTFDFIAQILLQLLEFLYGLLHNWGWTIIVFSLVIYLVLYPLSLKQMRSMKEMQALQPKIEELRKAYKDNPQKLNKEIMELYREHKVNPFGGCLPLLLQLPIFFALYQVLMRSVALKGANFLWIKDLSEPDRLFILPRTLPILGNEINILPILMTLGMFIQQKISLVSSATSSAEQQRMMMIIMPLMFGFIFYHMPSGLVLYWFINSTLMLLYQWRVSRTK